MMMMIITMKLMTVHYESLICVTECLMAIFCTAAFKLMVEWWLGGGAESGVGRRKSEGEGSETRAGNAVHI